MDRQTRHIKENFIRPSTSISKQDHDGIKTFGYFAVGPHQSLVKRFTLLFRDGERISVPYAFLPVIKLDQNGQIKITSGEIIIQIMGRGLGELEAWLSVEKVIWIKESESSQDDEQEAVFVSSIETEGL